MFNFQPSIYCPPLIWDVFQLLLGDHNVFRSRMRYTISYALGLSWGLLPVGQKPPQEGDCWSKVKVESVGSNSSSAKLQNVDKYIDSVPFYWLPPSHLRMYCQKKREKKMLLRCKPARSRCRQLHRLK